MGIRVKKGDTVEVIAGDDRGKRGEVRLVLPKENRVVVAGVNMVTKHQRPIRAAGDGFSPDAFSLRRRSIFPM